jgi:hypothetical protein
VISSGGLRAIELTIAFSTLRGLVAAVFAPGAGEPDDPLSFFIT